MSGTQGFVVFNLLPEVQAALHEAASKVVRKAAFDLEFLAKQKAPVDTGYLRNSIYTVTNDSSDYGQHVSGAAKPGQTLLPEVDKPTDDLTAYVAVGANYGAFVEYGTSRMNAQPYLTPAADAIRLAFTGAMAALESSIRKVVP